MGFPDSPRVLYEKNPLEEVICQLRFPPILRIDAQVPADFQDAVRAQYPLFEEERAADKFAGLPPEVAKIVEAELLFRTGKTGYKVRSADELWTVSLTRDFVSLSTRKYAQWNEFKGHLELPVKRFVQTYEPAFYSRIGLRYRNVIRRSALGLAEVSWSELLKPYIAGEFSSRDVSNHIIHASREIGIRLPNGNGQVVVRHGLALAKKTGEECYVIDSDFFVEERSETGDAFRRLEHFNREAGHLFRWCIEDRLHRAMRPR